MAMSLITIGVLAAGNKRKKKHAKTVGWSTGSEGETLEGGSWKSGIGSIAGQLDIQFGLDQTSTELDKDCKTGLWNKSVLIKE